MVRDASLARLRPAGRDSRVERVTEDDVNHVEAVEQILSNFSGLHAREGTSIGGRKHSEHRGIAFLSALQKSTEPRLCLERHVFEVKQQERASTQRIDGAEIRERPLCAPDGLELDVRLEGAGVQHREGTGSPQAPAMNPHSNCLGVDAFISGDEDRRVAACRQLDIVPDSGC